MDREMATLHAEQRILLRRFYPLLKATETLLYANAKEINPYLGNNPDDFRHACIDCKEQMGFPIIIIGAVRPTLKIPIVPFVSTLTGIAPSRIYEMIEWIQEQGEEKRTVPE